MKILKQLHSLLSMMGVYQYLSPQQISQATVLAYMLTVPDKPHFNPIKLDYRLFF